MQNQQFPRSRALRGNKECFLSRCRYIISVCLLQLEPLNQPFKLVSKA